MKKNNFGIVSESTYKYSIRENEGCYNAPCIFIEECTSLFDIAQYYIQKKERTIHLKKDYICSGTVFLTQQQTAGRGQFDRKWISEKGKSLLMVLVIAQQESVQKDKWSRSSQTRYNHIMKSIALAIIQSIQYCSILMNKPLKHRTLFIKEPNDVLVENRKIAGILIIPYLTWDLIGIGMNIKQYQWEHMSISGIAPISFADMGIHIEISHIYNIICRHIENVFAMKEEELQRMVQCYM